MMDPGALGTLLIGLRANDAELDFGTADEGRGRTARSSVRPLLALAARALRRLADRLEPASLEAEPSL